MKTEELVKNPEFMTDRLIECIGSHDARVRRTAVAVSKNFTNISKEHQMRVIFLMSNKIKI